MRAKPSSHSLLISTTAALANISMMEASLLWKATQLLLSMSARFGGPAGSNDVSGVKLPSCEDKQQNGSSAGLPFMLIWVKTHKNVTATGNGYDHVTRTWALLIG